MTSKNTKLRGDRQVFLFFRKEGFYPVEIPADQVLANVELNPGTLKVTKADGVTIVWQPS